MKPIAPLPRCVTTPGTMPGLRPRPMPALPVACPVSDGVPQPEDMVAIRIRIAKAESERDAWRASGNQEKYLEAYSMVEALDLQLDGLRQTARRSEAENAHRR